MSMAPLDPSECETVADEVAERKKSKATVRKRAETIKPFQCKNLIAVLECPNDMFNIGTVIRNVNALGVEKVYVVDPAHALSDDWQKLRERRKLSKLSVSAVKWTFVKRFENTEKCFDHLEKNNFSVVTSPHVKGKNNVVLHEGDYATHLKLAVRFGSEARGISDLAVERSDMCISIPMYGFVDSLNLGTSTGIVLYEATKQRREYQSKYRLRDHRGKPATPLLTIIPHEDNQA